MTTMKLTHEQEVQAFTFIRRGGVEGEQAKAQFVHLNQRLVGRIAKKYKDKGLTWEELLSAGNVGLLQAVNGFDHKSGYKFSTFAWPWIEGEIKQLFLSTKQQKNSDKKIRQTTNGVPLVDSVPTDEDECVDGAVLENDNTPLEETAEGDTPEAVVKNDRLDEHAEHVDLSELDTQNAEVKSEYRLTPQEARTEGIGSVAGCAEWDNLRGEDVSYDPRPSGGQAINFASDLSTGEMTNGDLAQALEQAINKLEDPRQRQVIAMHMGLFGYSEHTFAEIGKSLGVTTSRAESIQKQAFKHLSKDATLALLFEQLT